MKTTYNTVDKYISTFPSHTQLLLHLIRSAIKRKVPEAVESIAYGMPAYKTNGRPLVYFAGYKNHIGFYALPSGQAEFAAELSIYKQGKGSVQFPLDKEIPYNLIERMVEFRANENLAKAEK